MWPRLARAGKAPAGRRIPTCGASSVYKPKTESLAQASWVRFLRQLSAAAILAGLPSLMPPPPPKQSGTLEARPQLTRGGNNGRRPACSSSATHGPMMQLGGGGHQSNRRASVISPTDGKDLCRLTNLVPRIAPGPCRHRLRGSLRMAIGYKPGSHGQWSRYGAEVARVFARYVRAFGWPFCDGGLLWCSLLWLDPVSRPELPRSLLTHPIPWA